MYIGCTASTAYRCHFRKWQLERSCSTSSWRGCQRMACCQQSVSHALNFFFFFGDKCWSLLLYSWNKFCWYFTLLFFFLLRVSFQLWISLIRWTCSMVPLPSSALLITVLLWLLAPSMLLLYYLFFSKKLNLFFWGSSSKLINLFKTHNCLPHTVINIIWV